MESAAQGNQVEMKGLLNDELNHLLILYTNYAPIAPFLGSFILNWSRNCI